MPGVRICESAVATTSPAVAGGTAFDVEADFVTDFEAAAGAGADIVKMSPKVRSALIADDPKCSCARLKRYHE